MARIQSVQGQSVLEGGVLRAAGLMSVATFLSRIMGLVREQVFAYLFGAGNATDAFNVAFRIPNLLRDLFAEGAMSASLVPTFTQVRVQEGDRSAWRLAGRVFRVLFLVVGLISALGVFFAPHLVRLYAASYEAIPEKFELTVRLTRILFPFFPCVALAAAFMGILNACGVFFLPAFSSALFNLGSVIAGVVLAQFYGIEGMAIGVVFGGMIQALCQLPKLYSIGYRWPRRESSDQSWPTWRQDPALKRMLWMMLPGTVGLAATQINILVNTVLATSQGPGAVSWLSYAFRLLQFPIGIFGVSLASATLPVVARQWVERDIWAVGRTLDQSLRRVFAINLPAAAGLAFLGVPIIRLIFQHGRFGASDTEATAMALAMYSIGLPAYSAVKVLVPACYAMGNTRIPVVSSFLAVGVTITLNLLMVKPFGYWGLALGTSLAAIVNVAFLAFSVKNILKNHLSGAGLGQTSGFSIGALMACFAKNTLASVAMGWACAVSYRWLDSVSSVEILKVSLVMVEGAILVALLAKVLGLRETLDVLELFSRKVKKKLS